MEAKTAVEIAKKHYVLFFVADKNIKKVVRAMQEYGQICAEQARRDERERHEKIVSLLKTLMGSVMAHPGYKFGDENDEWHGKLSLCQKALESAGYTTEREGV